MGPQGGPGGEAQGRMRSEFRTLGFVHTGASLLTCFLLFLVLVLVFLALLLLLLQ